MILHQKYSPAPSKGLRLHQTFSIAPHKTGRLAPFLILLGQVMIILMGLIGAGYTLLTSFSIPHYPLILLPFLFFCTLYWSFLLTRKSPFWALLGLSLPLIPAFFLLFPIREGFIVTANCIIQAINQQMNWNLFDYVTLVSPSQFAYVATIFFLFVSAYFSFLLCWAVIKMHSFLVVLFLTLPFLFGLLFLLIPSYLPILMLAACWMSLFSMYPIKTRKKNVKRETPFISLPYKKILSFELSDPKIIHPVMVKSGVILICSTLLCVSLLFCCFPKSHYQRSDQMNQWKNNLVYGIQNLITKGEFSTKGVGGLSAGKLSQLGNLSFQRIPALKMSTNCPEPMYLRGWVGCEYDGTQWINSNGLSEKYQKEVAGNAFPIPQFQVSSFLAKYGNQTDGHSYTWFGELQYINAPSRYIYIPYTTDNLSTGQISYIDDREIIVDGNLPNQSYQFSFYSPHDNQFFYSSGSEGLEADNFFPNLYDNNQYSSGLVAYQNREETYQRYVRDAYTQLPEHTREIAQQFLEESLLSLPTDPSAYNPMVTQDVVRQITNYLTGNYTYTLSPGSTPSDKDFVEYFLFENKKGYCSHFASATAVILRSLGIPTRYVEGYVVTESDIKTAESNSGYQYEYMINDTNAHAWVEVYQEKVGWIPFETTPGYAGLQQINLEGEAGGSSGKAPGNGQYSDMPYPDLGVNSSENSSDISSSESVSSSIEPIAPSSSFAPSSPAVNSFSLSPQWKLVLVLVGFALLLAALTVGVLSLRQRIACRQRKKALDSSSANEQAKKYFQDLWTAMNYDGFPNKGSSLLEYAQQAARRYPFIEETEMMEMADLSLKASYSREEISPEELDHIMRFTTHVAHSIYQKYPLWKRIIFKYIHNLY